MSGWGLVYQARWVFLDGVLTTLLVFVPATAVLLAVALPMGLAQLSRWPVLRLFAVLFVEFFRGVPLLVQLFWLYFCLPYAGVNLEPISTGILACGVVSGAYGAEIVRAAVRAVPRPLVEAGIALNYTPAQRLQKIVLPVAVPIALPPLCNQTIELLKSTALVSLITVNDLAFQAATLRTTTMRSLEVFGTTLVIYFVLSMAISIFFRMLERVAWRGQVRGGVH